MCKRSGEIVDHLLLHCSTARRLGLLYSAGLGFIMPKGVMELLLFLLAR